MISMEDKILFHGSRGGINEKIQPLSRFTCDFGKGFYMGTDIMQAKGIVSNDFDPYIYTLKFNLSEIPDNRILDLRNNDMWIYTILANRRKVKDFNELPLAKNLLDMCNDYDVIIGTIADDSMSKVMEYFRNNLITNKTLEKCIKTVDLGTQYVAKTEFACSKIEILDCKEITYDMASEAKRAEEIKRLDSKQIIDKMIVEHRNEGLFLDEIIKREKSLQKNPVKSFQNDRKEKNYER